MRPSRRGFAGDRRDLEGPFDIVGDVHGCADELEALLDLLGYRVSWRTMDGRREAAVSRAAGRTLVFVGDLTDRGPRSADTLRIALASARDGFGLAVRGNHDDKLLRWLSGNPVRTTHGLQGTVDELTREGAAFRAEAEAFLRAMPSHYLLDGGGLVVAHAGIAEPMIGRDTAAARSFALYGQTTGRTDAFGLPERLDWAADYRGPAAVVYGHTPRREAAWVNNTLCIDTGCVFGGRLTALRWPERDLVSVPARRTYAEPVRPLG